MFAAPEAIVRVVRTLDRGIYFNPKVAKVDDRFFAVRNNHSDQSMVYLIKDAHMNASAQVNIRKVLKKLQTQQVCDLVFTEAAIGDVSLSFLKAHSDPRMREEIGRRFLNKGLMNGVEYHSLTFDEDVQVWGVEEENLYQLSTSLFKDIVGAKDEVGAYLNHIKATYLVVRNKLFNSELKAFDQVNERFGSIHELGIDRIKTYQDYYDQLGIPLKNMPDIKKLINHIKKEQKLKFDLVQNEFKDFSKNMKGQNAGHIPFDKLSLFRGVKDVAIASALIDHVDSERYVNLHQYLSLMKGIKNLNMKKVVEQLLLMERMIYKALAKTSSEIKLIEIYRSINLLQKLISVKLNPDEYRELYVKNTYGDIEHITGFLNQQLLQLDSHHERAILLNEEYGEIAEKALEFYKITLNRDEYFIEQMIKKSNSLNKNRYALIVGGYHADNLKRILRSKNMSFVEISPTVLHETDTDRYENTILGLRTDKINQSMHAYAAHDNPNKHVLMTPYLRGSRLGREMKDLYDLMHQLNIPKSNSNLLEFNDNHQFGSRFTTIDSEVVEQLFGVSKNPVSFASFLQNIIQSIDTSRNDEVSDYMDVSFSEGGQEFIFELLKYEMVASQEFTVETLLDDEASGKMIRSKGRIRVEERKGVRQPTALVVELEIDDESVIPVIIDISEMLRRDVWDSSDYKELHHTLNAASREIANKYTNNRPFVFRVMPMTRIVDQDGFSWVMDPEEASSEELRTDIMIFTVITAITQPDGQVTGRYAHQLYSPNEDASVDWQFFINDYSNLLRAKGLDLNLEHVGVIGHGMAPDVIQLISEGFASVSASDIFRSYHVMADFNILFAIETGQIPDTPTQLSLRGGIPIEIADQPFSYIFVNVPGISDDNVYHDEVHQFFAESQVPLDLSIRISVSNFKKILDAIAIYLGANPKTKVILRMNKATPGSAQEFSTIQLMVNLVPILAPYTDRLEFNHLSMDFFEIKSIDPSNLNGSRLSTDPDRAVDWQERKRQISSAAFELREINPNGFTLKELLKHSGFTDSHLKGNKDIFNRAYYYSIGVRSNEPYNWFKELLRYSAQVNPVLLIATILSMHKRGDLTFNQAYPLVRTIQMLDDDDFLLKDIAEEMGVKRASLTNILNGVNIAYSQELGMLELVEDEPGLKEYLEIRRRFKRRRMPADHELKNRVLKRLELIPEDALPKLLVKLKVYENSDNEEGVDLTKEQKIQVVGYFLDGIGTAGIGSEMIPKQFSGFYTKGVNSSTVSRFFQRRSSQKSREGALSLLRAELEAIGVLVNGEIDPEQFNKRSVEIEDQEIIDATLYLNLNYEPEQAKKALDSISREDPLVKKRIRIIEAFARKMHNNFSMQDLNSKTGIVESLVRTAVGDLKLAQLGLYPKPVVDNFRQFFRILPNIGQKIKLLSIMIQMRLDNELTSLEFYILTHVMHYDSRFTRGDVNSLDYIAKTHNIGNSVVSRALNSGFTKVKKKLEVRYRNFIPEGNLDRVFREYVEFPHAALASSLLNNEIDPDRLRVIAYSVGEQKPNTLAIIRLHMLFGSNLDQELTDILIDLQSSNKELENEIRSFIRIMIDRWSGSIYSLFGIDPSDALEIEDIVYHYLRLPLAEFSKQFPDQAFHMATFIYRSQYNSVFGHTSAYEGSVLLENLPAKILLQEDGYLELIVDSFRYYSGRIHWESMHRVTSLRMLRMLMYNHPEKVVRDTIEKIVSEGRSYLSSEEIEDLGLDAPDPHQRYVRNLSLREGQVDGSEDIAHHEGVASAFGSRLSQIQQLILGGEDGFLDGSRFDTENQTEFVDEGGGVEGVEPGDKINASRLSKKNNHHNRIKRKYLVDFGYIPYHRPTIALIAWNTKRSMNQVEGQLSRFKDLRRKPSDSSRNLNERVLRMYEGDFRIIRHHMPTVRLIATVEGISFKKIEKILDQARIERKQGARFSQNENGDSNEELGEKIANGEFVVGVEFSGFVKDRIKELDPNTKKANNLRARTSMQGPIHYVSFPDRPESQQLLGVIQGMQYASFARRHHGFLSKNHLQALKKIITNLFSAIPRVIAPSKRPTKAVDMLQSLNLPNPALHLASHNRSLDEINSIIESVANIARAIIAMSGGGLSQRWFGIFHAKSPQTIEAVKAHAPNIPVLAVGNPLKKGDEFRIAEKEGVGADGIIAQAYLVPNSRRYEAWWAQARESNLSLMANVVIPSSSKMLHIAMIQAGWDINKDSDAANLLLEFEDAEKRGKDAVRDFRRRYAHEQFMRLKNLGGLKGILISMLGVVPINDLDGFLVGIEIESLKALGVNVTVEPRLRKNSTTVGATLNALTTLNQKLANVPREDRPLRVRLGQTKLDHFNPPIDRRDIYEESERQGWEVSINLQPYLSSEDNPEFKMEDFGLDVDRVLNSEEFMAGRFYVGNGGYARQQFGIPWMLGDYYWKHPLLSKEYLKNVAPPPDHNRDFVRFLAKRYFNESILPRIKEKEGSGELVANSNSVFAEIGVGKPKFVRMFVEELSEIAATNGIDLFRYASYAMLDLEGVLSSVEQEVRNLHGMIPIQFSPFNLKQLLKSLEDLEDNVEGYLDRVHLTNVLGLLPTDRVRFVDGKVFMVESRYYVSDSALTELEQRFSGKGFDRGEFVRQLSAMSNPGEDMAENSEAFNAVEVVFNEYSNLLGEDFESFWSIFWKGLKAEDRLALIKEPQNHDIVDPRFLEDSGAILIEIQNELAEQGIADQMMLLSNKAVETVLVLLEHFNAIELTNIYVRSLNTYKRFHRRSATAKFGGSLAGWLNAVVLMKAIEKKYPGIAQSIKPVDSLISPADKGFDVWTHINITHDFAIENTVQWLGTFKLLHEFDLGMLYGDMKRWWDPSSEEPRDAPHEGIDVRGSPGEPVLSLEAGEVAAIIPRGPMSKGNDAIAQSVVIKTQRRDEKGRTFFYVLGHIDLEESIEVGTVLKQHDLVGRIGNWELRGKHNVSHVHLSLGWVDESRESFNYSNLNWSTINSNPLVELFDPLPRARLSSLIKSNEDRVTILTIPKGARFSFNEVAHLSDQEHDRVVAASGAMRNIQASNHSIGSGIISDLLLNGDWVRVHLGLDPVALIEISDNRIKSHLHDIAMMQNQSINTAIRVIQVDNDEFLIFDVKELRKRIYHNLRHVKKLPESHHYYNLIRFDHGIVMMIFKEWAEKEGAIFDLIKKSTKENLVKDERLFRAQKTDAAIRGGRNVLRKSPQKVPHLVFPSVRKAKDFEPSIVSFLKSLHWYGHQMPTVWVFDDLSADDAEAKRDMLRRLSQKFEVKIHYVGKREKREFIRLLANSDYFRKKKLNEEDIQRIFFQENLFGSNRNFIQAYMAGKIYMSVDDDARSFVTSHETVRDTNREEWTNYQLRIVQIVLDILRPIVRERLDAYGEGVESALELDWNAEIDHSEPYGKTLRRLTLTAHQLGEDVFDRVLQVVNEVPMAKILPTGVGIGNHSFYNIEGILGEANQEYSLLADLYGAHQDAIGLRHDQVGVFDSDDNDFNVVSVKPVNSSGNIRLVESHSNLHDAGSYANYLVHFLKSGIIRSLKGYFPRRVYWLNRYDIVSDDYHFAPFISTINNSSAGFVPPGWIDSVTLGMAIQRSDPTQMLMSTSLSADHEGQNSPSRHDSKEGFSVDETGLFITNYVDEIISSHASLIYHGAQERSNVERVIRTSFNQLESAIAANLLQHRSADGYALSNEAYQITAALGKQLELQLTQNISVTKEEYIAKRLDGYLEKAQEVNEHSEGLFNTTIDLDHLGKLPKEDLSLTGARLAEVSKYQEYKNNPRQLAETIFSIVAGSIKDDKSSKGSRLSPKERFVLVFGEESEAVLEFVSGTSDLDSIQEFESKGQLQGDSRGFHFVNADRIIDKYELKIRGRKEPIPIYKKYYYPRPAGLAEEFRKPFLDHLSHENDVQQMIADYHPAFPISPDSKLIPDNWFSLALVQKVAFGQDLRSDTGSDLGKKFFRSLALSLGIYHQLGAHFDLALGNRSRPDHAFREIGSNPGHVMFIDHGQAKLNILGDEVAEKNKLIEKQSVVDSYVQKGMGFDLNEQLIGRADDQYSSEEEAKDDFEAWYEKGRLSDPDLYRRGKKIYESIEQMDKGKITENLEELNLDDKTALFEYLDIQFYTNGDESDLSEVALLTFFELLKSKDEIHDFNLRARSKKAINEVAGARLVHTPVPLNVIDAKTYRRIQEDLLKADWHRYFTEVDSDKYADDPSKGQIYVWNENKNIRIVKKINGHDSLNQIALEKLIKRSSYGAPHIVPVFDSNLEGYHFELDLIPLGYISVADFLRRIRNGIDFIKTKKSTENDMYDIDELQKINEYKTLEHLEFFLKEGLFVLSKGLGVSHTHPHNRNQMIRVDVNTFEFRSVVLIDFEHAIYRGTDWPPETIDSFMIGRFEALRSDLNSLFGNSSDGAEGPVGRLIGGSRMSMDKISPVLHPIVHDLNELTEGTTTAPFLEFIGTIQLAVQLEKLPIERVMVVGRGLTLLPMVLSLMGKEVVFVDVSKDRIEGAEKAWELIRHSLPEYYRKKSHFRVIQSEIGALDLVENGLDPHSFDLITFIDLARNPQGSMIRWMEKAKELAASKSHVLIDEDPMNSMFPSFQKVFADHILVENLPQFSGSYNQQRLNYLYRVNNPSARLDVRMSANRNATRGARLVSLDVKDFMQKVFRARVLPQKFRIAIDLSVYDVRQTEGELRIVGVGGHKLVNEVMIKGKSRKYGEALEVVANGERDYLSNIRLLLEMDKEVAKRGFGVGHETPNKYVMVVDVDALIGNRVSNQKQFAHYYANILLNLKNEAHIVLRGANAKLWNSFIPRSSLEISSKNKNLPRVYVVSPQTRLDQLTAGPNDRFAVVKANPGEQVVVYGESFFKYAEALGVGDLSLAHKYYRNYSGVNGKNLLFGDYVKMVSNFIKAIAHPVNPPVEASIASTLRYFEIASRMAKQSV